MLKQCILIMVSCVVLLVVPASAGPELIAPIDGSWITYYGELGNQHYFMTKHNSYPDTITLYRMDRVTRKADHYPAYYSEMNQENLAFLGTAALDGKTTSGLFVLDPTMTAPRLLWSMYVEDIEDSGLGLKALNLEGDILYTSYLCHDPWYSGVAPNYSVGMIRNIKTGDELLAGYSLSCGTRFGNWLEIRTGPKYSISILSYNYYMLDVTTGKTYLVRSGADSSSLKDLGVHGSKLFFRYGDEVFAWDGGKKALKTYGMLSVDPGTTTSSPVQFALLNNRPVIGAVSGGMIQFFDMAGSVPKPLLANAVSVGGYGPSIVFGDSILFFGYSGGKYRLWVFKTTPAYSLQQVGPEFSTPPANLMIAGQSMVFTIQNGTTDGLSFWRCDMGATMTVQLVCDGFRKFWNPHIRNTNYFLEPNANQDLMAPVGNGRYFFVADDNGYLKEPWITDLTPAGTLKLKECNDGTSYSLSGDCRRIEGTTNQFAFISRNGGTRRDIWISDGTPKGTYPLKTVADSIDSIGILWISQDEVGFLGSKPGKYGVFVQRLRNGAKEWTHYY